MWFLLMAGVINTYNWMAFVTSLKASRRHTPVTHKNRGVMVDITLFSILGFICFWFIGVFSFRCATDEVGDINLAFDLLEWFGLICFAIVGTVFIYSGHLLKKTLRRWNEDLEEMARTRINLAIYLISIPFFVRSIYLLIRQVTSFDDRMQESVNNDTPLAPIVTFLFIFIADIIPITSQLVSMMVVVDTQDLGKHKEDEITQVMTEESEYINAAINSLSGTNKGSFMSEGSNGSKRKYLVNGSKEYSGGIVFSGRGETGASGSSEDSD